MKKEKADHLIRKLGIQDIMERIIPDHNGYEKFDRIITKILNQTDEIVLKYDLRDVSQHKPYWLAPGQNRKTLVNPSKSIEYFRRFYGVNQESETLDELSKMEGISRGYLCVSIDYIVEFMKQKHRKEIIISTI